MNGMNLLAKAASQLSDVTKNAQMSAAQDIVNYIWSYSQLSGAWAKQWQTDSQIYYDDSLNSISNQTYVAIAASDYAVYQQGVNEGQLEMSKQEAALQTSKALLQQLGDAMEQVFQLLMAPEQLNKAVSQSILSLGSS